MCAASTLASYASVEQGPRPTQMCSIRGAVGLLRCTVSHYHTWLNACTCSLC